MTKVVKVQQAKAHLSALLKLVESGEDVVISERRARCVGGVNGVELAVTARHALLAGSLAWEHRDPFGRMLAAQAMVGSMTLVTRDEAFAALAFAPCGDDLTGCRHGSARTGIAELDGVLTELVDTARDVLGDDLVGVYLQGSFALGGADDESDCDFLVAADTPVDDSRLTALRAFHGDLPHRPGHWNQHLEGSYPVAADLADLSALGWPWP